MTDIEILALFNQRSEQALQEVDKRFGNLCRSIAGRILADPEDVRECVDDTYLALWNAIPPVMPDYLGAYIATIVRNLAMKRMTENLAQKRNPASLLSFTELGECFPSRSTPETEIEKIELAGDVAEFLRLQDPDSRKMFMRRYWFFESIRELSQAFGCSDELVKSRLMRMRRNLKKFLSERGYSYGK